MWQALFSALGRHQHTEQNCSCCGGPLLSFIPCSDPLDLRYVGVCSGIQDISIQPAGPGHLLCVYSVVVGAGAAEKDRLFSESSLRGEADT